MSLFAKILTGLNVLAAIALLIIAGKDYGLRQSWAKAVFLNELAIQGLPLEADDGAWPLPLGSAQQAAAGDRHHTWRAPGRRLIDDLGPETLNSAFRGAGEPVQTQQEELERIKAQVLNDIDGAANEREKRQKLAAYLLPLAVDIAERDKLSDWIAPNSKTTLSIDRLRGDLEARINDALRPIELNPDSETRFTREMKRRDIAHLLYNLNPTGDANQHARVLAVIGLEAYTREASAQAANLVQMGNRVQSGLDDEQAAFVRRYEALIPDLNLLSGRLKATEARLQEQKKLIAQHQGLLNVRKAEVAELNQQLDKATKEAAAEMVALAAIQKQLFDLQRELANVLDANGGLERKIRGVEQGPPERTTTAQKDR